MDHTEETQNYTEQEEPEQLQVKPRKKMTFTEEQLVRKRASMQKAREHRNKNADQYQKEINVLKKELLEKEAIKIEAPAPIPKINKSKPKKQVIKQIIQEEEDDDDDEEEEEEVIERVILRKKKPVVMSNRELVERTYKEQLQARLNEERRMRVMADLFDF